MFCNQCQETAKNSGCTVRGVCGKSADVADLQDGLIHALKGIAISSIEAGKHGIEAGDVSEVLLKGLFSTITNANFDRKYFLGAIKEALGIRDDIIKKLRDAGYQMPAGAHGSVTWVPEGDSDIEKQAAGTGLSSTENEDIRALRSLVLYGLKGMAAYAHHAWVQGYRDEAITAIIVRALAAITDDGLSADELVSLVMECGKFGVDVMALLDRANNESFGTPEPATVKTGVGTKPGILVSGHDLPDLLELLKQTEGQGIDIYTHGEMLPAHGYPHLRKYTHLVGNYGGSWWKQGDEFEKFNGPILMTTNCLIPPKERYRDRVYTTGVVGFEGLRHIADSPKGGRKDFSAIIEHAKKCPPPEELENGTVQTGFAHAAVGKVAGVIVDAVKSGAIGRFYVMAGCDGRMKSRDYYTEFAKNLPGDSVILTAGCAKYRYNKLNLGSIGGVPRVVDAGQCNDSYSLALIALKLKEAFGLDDINKLPVVYNIAWYEQKAVIVLLALLYLGVKNIHLGPTLPGFLSPAVTGVLVKNFGIGGISTVEDDIRNMGLAK
jgi:hydroxylamine reductase